MKKQTAKKILSDPKNVELVAFGATVRECAEMHRDLLEKMRGVLRESLVKAHMRPPALVLLAIQGAIVHLESAREGIYSTVTATRAKIMENCQMSLNALLDDA